MIISNGKAARKMNKMLEWGGFGERKVGLVERLGPFWILSEEMTSELRPEWRKGVSHVRIRGKNIPEGTARCRGPQAEADLVYTPTSQPVVSHTPRKQG